jgi:hypothetical protein
MRYTPQLRGHNYKRVSAFDTLMNLTGLYVLTSEGELGVYRDGKTLVLDEALTRELAEHLRRLLSSYLSDTRAGNYRLGIVYHAREQRPWGSDTLALEESVVRDVYAVSGQRADLTTFQKKNREKSIYRGIELLLEYRLEGAPETPVYCPILFDRQTTLDHYPEMQGADTPGEPVPVLEVLNLVADVSTARRNTPAIESIMKSMSAYVVRKDMRDERFSILGKVDKPMARVDSGSGQFFDVDKRAERGVNFSDSLAGAERVQAGQRVEQVERWLKHPLESVDAMLMMSFAQFKQLPPRVLEVLCRKSPVYTAPSGTRLLNRDMTDPWNLYLLEGTVSLEAADGATLFISGGTKQAASPIAFLKPRKYTVTTVTDVSFLWINDAMLNALLEGAKLK